MTLSQNHNKEAEGVAYEDGTADNSISQTLLPHVSLVAGTTWLPTETMSLTASESMRWAVPATLTTALLAPRLRCLC